MTKKSVDQFCAFLDVLQGTLKYAETSRALGQHPSTIFHWLKQSKAAAQHPEQPSEFHFEHAGEMGWLHEHVRGVITISIEEIESAARSRALNGHTSIARFQGKTVWAEDPDLIGLDDETLKLCGYNDRLLRDPVTDRPIPEIITHAPSTDLVAMVLQAHSKIYRKQSSVSVDLNARVSGGVMVLGGSNNAQPKIAPHVTLPMLEIIDAANEEQQPIAAETFEQDDDAADIVEPIEYGDDDVEQDDGADDVAPVEQPTPTPAPAAAGPNPAIRRTGISDMERDLLARLKAKQGSPERVAPLSHAAPLQRASRDSEDRLGPGTIPPGAVKVV